MAQGCHVVATALGPFALYWRDDALIAAHLDDGPAEGQPPSWVQQLGYRVVSHLQGHPDAFADVLLDLTAVPPFHARVYDALRQVPPGRTTTYGELAAQVGRPGAARAVGQAVARNPWLLLVPCHRVLAANGRLGGFSAPGGAATKRAMLLKEKSSENRQQ